MRYRVFISDGENDPIETSLTKKQLLRTYPQARGLAAGNTDSCNWCEGAEYISITIEGDNGLPF